MSYISGVLIAAGAGTRMGSLKPLLPWNGMLLVEYQISNLLAAGLTEIIVVLGHRHEELEPHVRGHQVRYVVNHQYADGKTTSIKVGVREINDHCDGVMLLAVDQPRTAEITSKVLESHVSTNAVITSPKYQGHGGHPLVFSRTLFGELLDITEESEGIREVLRAHKHEINEVEFDDPMIALDINSPEDYQNAKVRYGI